MYVKGFVYSTGQVIGVKLTGELKGWTSPKGSSFWLLFLAFSPLVTFFAAVFVNYYDGL